MTQRCGNSSEIVSLGVAQDEITNLLGEPRGSLARVQGWGWQGAELRVPVEKGEGGPTPYNAVASPLRGCFPPDS